MSGRQVCLGGDPLGLYLLDDLVFVPDLIPGHVIRRRVHRQPLLPVSRLSRESSRDRPARCGSGYRPPQPAHSSAFQGERCDHPPTHSGPVSSALNCCPERSLGDRLCILLPAPIGPWPFPPAMISSFPYASGHCLIILRTGQRLRSSSRRYARRHCRACRYRVVAFPGHTRPWCQPVPAALALGYCQRSRPQRAPS